MFCYSLGPSSAVGKIGKQNEPSRGMRKVKRAVDVLLRFVECQLPLPVPFSACFILPIFVSPNFPRLVFLNNFKLKHEIMFNHIKLCRLQSIGTYSISWRWQGISESTFSHLQWTVSPSSIFTNWVSNPLPVIWWVKFHDN